MSLVLTQVSNDLCGWQPPSGGSGEYWYGRTDYPLNIYNALGTGGNLEFNEITNTFNPANLTFTPYDSWVVHSDMVLEISFQISVDNGVASTYFVRLRINPNLPSNQFADGLLGIGRPFYSINHTGAVTSGQVISIQFERDGGVSPMNVLRNNSAFITIKRIA